MEDNGLNTYTVHVRTIFECIYEIEAEDAEEAEFYAEQRASDGRNMNDMEVDHITTEIISTEEQ